MTTTSPFLKIVYEGWESHQQALMRAVTPLMPEQLAWRPAPYHSSVNEMDHLAYHVPRLASRRPACADARTARH